MIWELILAPLIVVIVFALIKRKLGKKLLDDWPNTIKGSRLLSSGLFFFTITVAASLVVLMRLLLGYFY